MKHRSILKKIQKINRSRQDKKQFKAQFIEFRNQLLQSGRSEFRLNWEDSYPILNENTTSSSFDAHYIYHTAWAARIVAQTLPSVHVDISSSLYFSTLVSAFVPVEFYDYRPVQLSLGNLTCKSADLLSLPFHDESISSLSCMHVIEHIGLGRYGDNLDPNGDLTAINELKRVLAKGGTLLFVTPVGNPKIRFNAHRIYSYDQVISYFSDLTVHQFALVDDNKQYLINPDPCQANQQNYGCGCWWFVNK